MHASCTGGFDHSATPDDQNQIHQTDNCINACPRILTFSTSVRAQAVGIGTYLQGNPDYTVAAKFVQLADAPAIFGDSPEAGIVLFAASDSAWKTAADALGEWPSRLRQLLTSSATVHPSLCQLCTKYVTQCA